MRVSGIVIAALLTTAAAAPAAFAQSSSSDSVAGRTVRYTGGPDYANAKPRALPMSPKAPSEAAAPAAPQASGPPRFTPGVEGTGKKTPTSVPAAKALESAAPPPPPEFGTGDQQPYTTSREPNASQDPHRRAGKLFFNDDGGSFVCSGSLIKPGVVVTAAHCVSKFGENRFYTDFQFIPAYQSGAAPFGNWTAKKVYVLKAYLVGTDSCAVSGVVCRDDIALIVLNAQSGAYPGTSTGTFGYGSNGFGFNLKSRGLLTQLGYPAALENGQVQMRTDSQSFVDVEFSRNNIMGSLQTGGSSGGPWLVNFGPAPTITGGGVGFGASAQHNIVVGVTSWGYVDTSATGPKQQGASPFLTANIDTLVDRACTTYPAAC